MALKAILTAEEHAALPEVLREHYKADGDQFVLDTDATSRVGEFRQNNIELKRQLEEAQEQAKRFKGIDPDKYKAALDKMQEIEDQKLIDAGQLDELLAQRTARMQADYDNKYKALEARNAELEEKIGTVSGQNKTLLIERDLGTALNAVGALRPGALRYALDAAKGTWVTNDKGELVPMRGDTVIIGKDGKSPMSMAEYAQQVLTDSPFLFEGNGGGGAKGGGDGDKRKTGQLAYDDKKGFSNNLEAIAKGEVQVSVPGNG